MTGALIEYAVILFKKQKEQKEPKKETVAHGKTGKNWLAIIWSANISKYFKKTKISLERKKNYKKVFVVALLTVLFIVRAILFSLVKQLVKRPIPTQLRYLIPKGLL